MVGKRGGAYWGKTTIEGEGKTVHFIYIRNKELVF